MLRMILPDLLPAATEISEKKYDHSFSLLGGSIFVSLADPGHPNCGPYPDFARGCIMNERSIVLRGDHITLAQAIKVAGLADTGGMAKAMAREGDLLVNGVAENRPGRKLRLGDRFGNPQLGEWTVVAEV